MDALRCALAFLINSGSVFFSSSWCIRMGSTIDSSTNREKSSFCFSCVPTISATSSRPRFISGSGEIATTRFITSASLLPANAVCASVFWYSSVALISSANSGRDSLLIDTVVWSNVSTNFLSSSFVRIVPLQKKQTRGKKKRRETEKKGTKEKSKEKKKTQRQNTAQCILEHTSNAPLQCAVVRKWSGCHHKWSCV